MSIASGCISSGALPASLWGIQSGCIASGKIVVNDDVMALIERSVKENVSFAKLYSEWIEAHREIW